jgi:hypothetical protein
MIVVMQALFNAPFSTTSVSMSGHTVAAAKILSSSSVNDALFTDLPGRQQPLVTVMYWGQPLGNPKIGSHAVLALRSDSGRIFFKNPQYRGAAPPSWVVVGGTGSNPPRQYEDPTGATESMASSDLANWILWYHVPNQALI